jgi:hypothetical protein
MRMMGTPISTTIVVGFYVAGVPIVLPTSECAGGQGPQTQWKHLKGKSQKQKNKGRNVLDF